MEELVQEEQLPMAFSDQELDDKGMRAFVELPEWELIDDRRILNDLRGIFPGFDFPDVKTLSSSMVTLDDFISYVRETLDDINKRDAVVAIQEITTNAALSVRKWFLGKAMEQVLTEHTYGQTAMGELSTATNISVSGLYHMRKVGRELSMKEVYTLGMYDAGWYNIRRMAYIRDADLRSRLITTYTTAVSDWNNAKLRENARTALTAAINSVMKPNYEELATSNPEALAEVRDMEEEAPEYAEARKLVTLLLRLYKRISADSLLTKAQEVFSNYFLRESVEGAEVLRADLLEDVDSLLKMLSATRDIVPVLTEELTSLKASTLLKDDEEEERDAKNCDVYVGAEAKQGDTKGAH